MASQITFPGAKSNQSKPASPKNHSQQNSTPRVSAPQSSLLTPATRRSQSSVEGRTPLHITHSEPAAEFLTETSENNDTLTNSNPNDIDALNEVIMAVDLRERGTVGCCYYIARDGKLCFMEDVRLGGVDVINTLKDYISPTVIIISARADEAIIDRLDPEGRSRNSFDDTNDLLHLPYLVEIRPSSEFNYETAKNKLVNLRLGSNDGPHITYTIPGDVVAAEEFDEEAGIVSRQGQLLRLSGWIDIESQLTVGCAGAVLSYLQRRRAVAFLPGDEAADALFHISTLEMFSMRDTMFINADTLTSLQIMQLESHPHSHNQGPTKSSSGSKEGLSVYGLFHNLARTPQGKFLLRQYFLRPSLNPQVINERLETIGVFLRVENAAPLESLVKNLQSVKNIRAIMINLRKGVGGGLGKGGGISRSVWAGIRQFVFHALKIRDAFQEVIGAEQLDIRKKANLRKLRRLSFCSSREKD